MPLRQVLVVDDEPTIADTVADLLRDEQYQVDVAGSAEEAIERLQHSTYHLVLTDFLLPGKTGVELARVVHQTCPATAIVLMTGHPELDTAVEALKRGASDYVRKPIRPDELRARVAELLAQRPDYLPNDLLQESHSGEVTFEGMLARSQVMRNVFEKIKLAAQSDATVLIVGESGTGKELAARAVHRRSQRARGPFVAVHTGAIPRDLISSELFGHEHGAFTGAVKRQEGRFEQAAGGTIFLDEISTMDERTQINLLRVLENLTFTRVGGRDELKADVRIVAASNRPLRDMMASGSFREDLYYRLCTIEIDLPPLRERQEDIVLLSADMLHRFAAHYNKPARFIPAETQRLLESYPWPGNIRELRNVIEQAVLLSRGPTLNADLLPQMLHRNGKASAEIRIPVGSSMAQAEQEIILRTLEAKGGNKKLTAEVLGISRRSLYNKLASFAAASGVKA